MAGLLGNVAGIGRFPFPRDREPEPATASGVRQQARGRPSPPITKKPGSFQAPSSLPPSEGRRGRPSWSLLAYADFGGFGVGSEHTRQWLATANYQPGERWVFSAGLRALSVDYRDGGTRLDARLAGPLVGASWRFRRAR